MLGAGVDALERSFHLKLQSVRKSFCSQATLLGICPLFAFDALNELGMIREETGAYHLDES